MKILTQKKQICKTNSRCLQSPLLNRVFGLKGFASMEHFERLGSHLR